MSSTESLNEESYQTDTNDEISRLKEIHKTEIEERDRIILDKVNELWTSIETHQVTNKKLSDELQAHNEEIVQCHKRIAELDNEIRLLKKANEDTGPRTEKVNQACQTDHTIPNDQLKEKIHQASQTDHIIPDATIFVTKEWHENEMRDYVQLVNDEHQSFVQAVQQQILIAEHNKEMAERETNNISQLRSENLMLKVDLSVINDIHEAEMAERTRVISDLFNENKTLRADLEAAISASNKKPRHVNLSYKQPATKTSFMTKIRNYME